MSRFISAIPNRGARLGHYFCEWNTSRLLAKENGLTFLHAPFSHACAKWESFLGFSSLYEQLEISRFSHVYESRATSLTSFMNYSPRGSLYLFDYLMGGQGVRNDLYEQNSELWQHFAHQRQEYPVFLFTHSNCLNIAVHIRRGDVKSHGDTSARYTQLHIYQDLINRLISAYSYKTAINIVIYTNGSREDVNQLAIKADFKLRILRSEFIDLASMCDSEIIVSSNSGFSFVPLLLSSVPRVIPPLSPESSNSFWHKWPSERLLPLDRVNTLSSSLGSIKRGTQRQVSDISRLEVVPISALCDTGTRLPSYSSIIVASDELRDVVNRYWPLDISFNEDFSKKSRRLDLIRHISVLTRPTAQDQIIGGSLDDSQSPTEMALGSIMIFAEDNSQSMLDLIIKFWIIHRHGQAFGSRPIIIIDYYNRVVENSIEKLIKSLSISRPVSLMRRELGDLLFEDVICFCIGTV